MLLNRDIQPVKIYNIIRYEYNLLMGILKNRFNCTKTNIFDFNVDWNASREGLIQNIIIT